MCILNFQAFRVFVTKKSSSAIGLMKWSEFISKIFEFIERNIGQEKGKFLGKVKESAFQIIRQKDKVFCEKRIECRFVI